MEQMSHQAMASFEGEITQIPPMYSAVTSTERNFIGVRPLSWRKKLRRPQRQVKLPSLSEPHLLS